MPAGAPIEQTAFIDENGGGPGVRLKAAPEEELMLGAEVFGSLHMRRRDRDCHAGRQSTRSEITLGPTVGL